MDPFQQEKHGEKAIQEQIARHMVGIVYGSGNHKWEGIGTGCLIKWKGSFVIVTADHVICDTNPEDLRFFFRPDETLKHASREELQALRGAPTKELKPFEELRLIQIIRNPDLDIAAIEVDSDIEKKYAAEFFP